MASGARHSCLVSRGIQVTDRPTLFMVGGPRIRKKSLGGAARDIRRYRPARPGPAEEAMRDHLEQVSKVSREDLEATSPAEIAGVLTGILFRSWR